MNVIECLAFLMILNKAVTQINFIYLGMRENKTKIFWFSQISIGILFAKFFFFPNWTPLYATVFIYCMQIQWMVGYPILFFNAMTLLLPSVLLKISGGFVELFPLN